MTAIATDRRRYDKPAQLSVQSAAEELKGLTKASLVLARRLNVKGPVLQQDAAVQKALREATRNLEQMRRVLGLVSTGNESAAPVATTATDAVTKLARDHVLVESSEICEKLGWTRQALSKALAARRIFFVEVTGVRLFPSFFADQRYERSQMEAVSKALGELPGGAKLQFFLSSRGSLGGKSVLDALARGEKDKVVAAAQAFAEG